LEAEKRRFNIHRAFTTEILFIFLGGDNLAASINRKYFKNVLAVPAHEWREPSSLPLGSELNLTTNVTSPCTGRHHYYAS
jgi:hypothetical protein